jgi:hypothetical protein
MLHTMAKIKKLGIDAGGRFEKASKAVPTTGKKMARIKYNRRFLDS